MDWESLFHIIPRNFCYLSFFFSFYLFFFCYLSLTQHRIPLNQSQQLELFSAAWISSLNPASLMDTCQVINSAQSKIMFLPPDLTSLEFITTHIHCPGFGQYKWTLRSSLTVFDSVYPSLLPHTGLRSTAAGMTFAKALSSVDTSFKVITSGNKCFITGAWTSNVPFFLIIIFWYCFIKKKNKFFLHCKPSLSC